MHNVPRGSETHFRVIIVSAQFDCLNSLKVMHGCELACTITEMIVSCTRNTSSSIKHCTICLITSTHWPLKRTLLTSGPKWMDSRMQGHPNVWVDRNPANETIVESLSFSMNFSFWIIVIDSFRTNKPRLDLWTIWEFLGEGRVAYDIEQGTVLAIRVLVQYAHTHKHTLTPTNQHTRIVLDWPGVALRAGSTAGVLQAAPARIRYVRFELVILSTRCVNVWAVACRSTKQPNRLPRYCPRLLCGQPTWPVQRDVKFEPFEGALQFGVCQRTTLFTTKGSPYFN